MKPTPERKPISLDMLPRSYVACHRIEDELLRRIRPLTVSSHGIHDSLEAQRSDPPAWCKAKAWERILGMMQGWTRAFGNLDMWWQLRQKEDNR